MRRGVLGVLVGLGLFAASCARPEATPSVQRAEPPPEAPAAEAQRTRLFFWQLSLGESSVYLLGSIHVARAGLYPLDRRIEAAFESSDVLALELSLDEREGVAAATRMMSAARLEPGQRLIDVVSAETWSLLESTLAARGGTLLGLRGFQPWFVALSLTLASMEEAGFSGDNGIDVYFHGRVQPGQRVVALETIDDQLAVFEQLSPTAQEAMLRETLETLDEQPAQLDLAFERWREGDAEALDQLLLEPMRREQPELFEQVFSARNRRMVDSLTALASAEPARYFVVVGAGHLVGKEGVVALLQGHGRAVEQLTALGTEAR
jgi:uncharacterized protein YbaP (TraB family)